MNTHKVKRQRTSDTKNLQQRTTTKLPPWNGQYSITGGRGAKLGLRAQPYPYFLMRYKTFSWFFGSHDNHLTRQ